MSLSNKKIGFIGLGHMGAPMAENLVKAGAIVKVYDLVPEAVAQLVREGAIAASSAQEAAHAVDVCFTMLQTSKQVLATCLGEHGIFNVLPPSALYIDTSSIAVEDTKHLHTEAKQHGLSMLDAPVSGGVKGAQAGTLTFMVGGEAEVFAQAEPMLSCMGKRVIHAGQAGAGGAAKLCNNMLLGISMIGVSEAFVLAKHLGLDPKVFFDIASNASGQCWSMTSYCPEPNVLPNVPSNNGYQPGFTAEMMLKDLKLSQAAAAFVNMHTRLGEQATAIYEEFVQEGQGKLDFSGVINLYKQGH